MQIDGIQTGHDHDAGQKSVDLKAGMDQRRDRARRCRRQKGKRQRDPGIDARHDQHSRHGRTRDETAVHGDIGKIVNAKSDENTHRHEGV